MYMNMKYGLSLGQKKALKNMLKFYLLHEVKFQLVRKKKSISSRENTLSIYHLPARIQHQLAFLKTLCIDKNMHTKEIVALPTLYNPSLADTHTI